jgi:hypothetical protein
VLLLSGSLHSVLTAVFLMLEKLPREPTSPGRAAGAAAASAANGRGREDVVRVARGAGRAAGARCTGPRGAASRAACGVMIYRPGPARRAPRRRRGWRAAEQDALPLLPLRRQVKMAVSRKLCGAVIGQKGQTIRDFMNDSGATIRVQVGWGRRVPAQSMRGFGVQGSGPLCRRG